MVIYGHMKAKSLLSTKNIPPTKKRKQTKKNQKQNRKTKEKENTSPKKCPSFTNIALLFRFWACWYPRCSDLKCIL